MTARQGPTRAFGALGLLIVAVAVVAMHSMHVGHAPGPAHGHLAHAVEHVATQTASVGMGEAAMAMGPEADSADCHSGCASSPLQEGPPNSLTVVCLAVLSTLALLSLFKLSPRRNSRTMRQRSAAAFAGTGSPPRRRFAPTVIQVGVLRT